MDRPPAADGSIGAAPPPAMPTRRPAISATTVTRLTSSTGSLPGLVRLRLFLGQGGAKGLGRIGERSQPERFQLPPLIWTDATDDECPFFFFFFFFFFF